MSVALYMDVHVRRAVTEALQERGVDVLTAQADDVTELDDADLLDRATALARVLFSQDADLLAEATKRQRSGVPFAGIADAHQLYVTVGQCVRDSKSSLKLVNRLNLKTAFNSFRCETPSSKRRCAKTIRRRDGAV